MEIGNNIVRYPLSKVLVNFKSIDEFNKVFVESSNIVTGNIQSFQKKLQVFCDVQKKYGLGLDEKSVLDTLLKYKEMCYPMVSHSETFRENYLPCYRVVRKGFLK